MSELTSNQLIKIIIGVAVFVIVIGGAYLLFKGRIFNFIEGLGSEFFRSLLR